MMRFDSFRTAKKSSGEFGGDESMNGSGGGGGGDGGGGDRFVG